MCSSYAALTTGWLGGIWTRLLRSTIATGLRTDRSSQESLISLKADGSRGYTENKTRYPYLVERSEL